MLLFATYTLIPVGLIGLGAVWGGLCVVLAVLYLTALTATLDLFVARVAKPLPESEFPAATGLSVTLALVHFVLLGLVVIVLAGNTLVLAEKLALFAAAGLFFGQVSNSNAHELIHRSGRGLHALGMWVYISLLFGHHTSAHPLVHHRLVATRADPSTARLGESLYRFMGRAWVGSFRAGFRAESARLAQTGRAWWRHPYLLYFGGAALFIILAQSFGGLLPYLGLVGFAQLQLLMSDYVQHYGLTRALGPQGKPEPMGPAHSWNAPHLASSALMLHAPRHSDHHAKPALPYPALGLPSGAPMLPRSLPVMACVALYPRLWRRVMDPLVARIRQV
jgi:alkane 1-monooxygenase